MTKRFEVSERSVQKWLRLRRYVTQSITNRNNYDFIITEKSSWNSLLKNASYALQNFNQTLIVQRGAILDLKLLLLSRAKKSFEPEGEKTWAHRVPLGNKYFPPKAQLHQWNKNIENGEAITVWSQCKSSIILNIVQL